MSIGTCPRGNGFAIRQVPKCQVTVRQLLSHRSGSLRSERGWIWLPFVGVFAGLRPAPSFEQYMAHGLRLRRRPGTELRYSNDAFILLGWLSAKLAGAEFADCARRAVLDPLDMHSSDFRPDAESLRSEKGAVYHRTASGFEPAVDNVGASGRQVLSTRPPKTCCNSHGWF